MKKRIQEMALRTWNVIGGDTLQCLEEAGENPVLNKEEVLEIVCDAGYMKTYDEDKEAYEEWNKISTYKQKLKVIEPAFPFKRYGW
jgi:hypothetical protein